MTIELIDKRGYLIISLGLAKEGKLLLRKPEGIKDWYQTLKVRNSFSQFSDGSLDNVLPIFVLTNTFSCQKYFILLQKDNPKLIIQNLEKEKF